MLKAIYIYIRRHTAGWLAGSLTAAVCTAALIPSAVAAAYGNGPYGTCQYQSGCKQSTTLTLPAASGPPAVAPLEVNINLADGQEIPRPGYTVIVTPLNGQGASFQQVQFYIDGKMAHTQTPGQDGTARWFWNVTRWPGTIIKVVVTGTDGQTVTKTFHVIITSAAQHGARSSAAASPSILQQIVSAPNHAVHSLAHTIAKLPPQVKYGLPYFLFLVLAGDTLLLLYRAQHEIAEAKRLQALLARERQTRDLKHTFVELVSHYLRTPLTLIGGGVDMAGQEGDTVRDSINRMNQSIDSLIAQLSEKGPAAAPAGSTGKDGRLQWRQPNLYVPIGLIGFVAFSFDYLAHHTRGFSVSTVNLIVQLVVFTTLCFIIYHVLRYRQLKGRDRAKLSQILTAEAAFGNERDELISVSGLQIKRSADQLAEQASQIKLAAARKFIDKGLVQLQDVIEKLLVANQLKGSSSTEPYVTADFETIVHESVAGVKEEIAAKAIKLTTGLTASFKVRNAELLAVALRTILDNAIAYSEQGGGVEVSVAVTGTSAVIAVVDHGQGIPEDKQYSLFQAFSKTEGAETFNHEGMGFSLYLDKLIMNYLVGDITVESAPNKGTKVSLILPQR